VTPLERPTTLRRRRHNRALGTPNADGSPLEGFVEAPLPGGSLGRLDVVTGWHTWDKGPVAGVVVAVDGKVVGGARQGTVLRHDVAAARNDRRYTASGWVVDLDLRAVTRPTINVQVTVFPGRDHPGVVLDPIEVEVLGEPTIDEHGAPIPPPPEVRGRVDVPAAGAVVELAPVLVRGWACSTSGAPITEVTLHLDDVVLGRARLGLDRADVAIADAAIDASVCGFEQMVDLAAAGIAPGPATLRARAVALDGTTTELVVPLQTVAARTALVDVATPPRTVGRTQRGPFSLLVVTHDLGYGGAQLWLHEALRATGAGTAYPCTVVAFGGGPLASALESMGVEVHVSSLLPVHDAPSYEGRLQELDAWLSGRGHTVALVNTFRAFAGADLAERRGLPVVWAIHESWPEPLIWAFDHPGVAVDPVVRGLASRSLRHAGRVVFESDATRALYEDRAPGRTAVVPYGVDTAALDAYAAATPRSAARATLGLDDAGRTLLVMGTLEPRKCQSLLTVAFAQIAANHPDASLVLVGDLGTPYSAAVHELVARTGLAGRVRIEGVVADPRPWYRAADALVCASDVESLPRSVLDAMCLGLPVVATDVFGLHELLDDGDTGLLFSPNDLASAVGALHRVLDLPDADLASIASRGRALVHERHDAGGYADELLSLLRTLHGAGSVRLTA
jgi:glycosyltransferase involved in cell wall biosynthesis